VSTYSPSDFGIFTALGTFRFLVVRCVRGLFLLIVSLAGVPSRLKTKSCLSFFYADSFLVSLEESVIRLVPSFGVNILLPVSPSLLFFDLEVPSPRSWAIDIGFFFFFLPTFFSPLPIFGLPFE